MVQVMYCTVQYIPNGRDVVATEQAFSDDGTSIAFERHGSGDLTVVLVEPPLRHRAFSAFQGLVPLLAQHATVVAYDRRGRGESGDGASYHPDREVEDLHAVIRAVDGPVGAYGYSAGALLALRAASRSTSVSRLVVLEPPVHDDDHPRPDPLTIELAQLLDRGDRAAAVRRFHESIGVPEPFMVEMMASDAWPAMLETAHTLVHDCQVADSVDDRVLTDVTVPTLVLDSEGSTDDLSGWAATVAERLPEGSHRSLDGAWHMVADADLAPVILEHLTGATPGSTGR